MGREAAVGRRRRPFRGLLTLLLLLLTFLPLMLLLRASLLLVWLFWLRVLLLNAFLISGVVPKLN